MRRLPAALAIAALLAIAPAAAHAAIIDAQPNGFDVKTSVTVKASADKVWAALMKPAAWWSSDHTWSKDAANLSVEPRLGGCFCEIAPNGLAVRHMSVVLIDPASHTLILEGALGPFLGTGSTGHMTWAVREKDGSTTITFEYQLGGYMPGGLDKLAPAADMVLGEQAGRLKSFLETGKPV